MRIRPSQVYNNVVLLLVGVVVIYTLYSLFRVDETPDHPQAHQQNKHLFLTIDRERVDGRFKALAPKRIFMWTRIFGEVDTATVKDCPALENRCIFDHDRSRVASADAVLFHMNDVKDSDLPPPETRSRSQRYVFMTMESPANSYARGEKGEKMKNFFNWTMTPLFSSDVIFKYGSFWLSAKDAELRGFKLESYALEESQMHDKIPSVFALISNCGTASKREVALRELDKHFNVTLAGKCATSEHLKNLCPKGNNCHEEFSKYAFFFAGENTACVDYVSEKYWERYNLPSIPIVMRRKDYEHQNLPTKSFIALDDFASPREMGEYLQKLVKDQGAYAEYFGWRNGGWTIAPWNTEGFRNGYCRLCERLWEEDQVEKTIPDAGEWYKKESACDNGEFVRRWTGGQ